MTDHSPVKLDLTEESADKEREIRKEDSGPQRAPGLRERLRKPGLLTSSLCLLALLIFQIPIAIVIIIVFGAKDAFVDDTAVMVTGTATNLLFAALVVRYLFGRESSSVIGARGIHLVHLLLLLLMALPLTVVASEIGNLSAEVFAVGEWFEIFQDFAERPWIVVFFCGCVLPGLGEELLFRGYLGRGLVARWGLFMGVLWTSLLFGLIHGHPSHAIPAFFLGVVLHLIYLSTKSIVAPILLHIANNALAFGLAKRADLVPVRGYNVLEEGGILHTPILLILSALLTTLALGALYYQTRVRWITPDGKTWSPGYVSAEKPPVELDATARASSARPIAVIVTAVAYLLFSAVLVQEVMSSPH